VSRSLGAEVLHTEHPPGEQASPIKGPAPETAQAPFHLVVQKRVAFFIDGFNLYHAIDDLQDNRLKWLNLKSLAESYLRAGDTLVSVAYFTAFNVWDKAKRQRHVAYANALQHLGVETILGGFLKTPKWCRKLNRSCNFHSEKKTDVGIAVRLIADAFEDKFDLAFLLTADSDHVPMVQRMRDGIHSGRLKGLGLPTASAKGSSSGRSVCRLPNTVARVFPDGNR
jgi:hypothetical protein